MGTHRASKSIRLRLFLESGGYCLYCCQYTPDFTADHFFPQARGGKTYRGNLVLACPSCNKRKTDRDPWEFIAAECEPGTLKRVNSYLKRPSVALRRT